MPSYIAQAFDGNEPSIKIGRSNDPKQRVRKLNAELIVVLDEPERVLHARYSAQRATCEAAAEARAYLRRHEVWGDNGLEDVYEKRVYPRSGDGITEWFYRRGALAEFLDELEAKREAEKIRNFIRRISPRCHVTGYITCEDPRRIWPWSRMVAA